MLCFGSEVMAKVKFFFSKVGQKSSSRSQGQNIWYQQKGPAIRNTYLYYKRLIFVGSKVIAKVKFVQKKVESQGHKVNIFDTER